MAQTIVPDANLKKNDGSCTADNVWGERQSSGSLTCSVHLSMNISARTPPPPHAYTHACIHTHIHESSLIAIRHSQVHEKKHGCLALCQVKSFPISRSRVLVQLLHRVYSGRVLCVIIPSVRGSRLRDSAVFCESLVPNLQKQASTLTCASPPSAACLLLPGARILRN